MNILKEKTCISLIGMPGAGKSYLSGFITGKYNFTLIELDEYIENKYKKTLFELLELYGEDKFKTIEEEALLDINFNNKKQIISTGGSVIYCKKGINHLQNKNNLIVYLKTDLDILLKLVSSGGLKLSFFSIAFSAPLLVSFTL